MNHFDKLRLNIQQLVFAVLFFENLILLGAWWLAFNNRHHVTLVMVLGASLVALSFSICIAVGLGRLVLQPLHALWQAILHISPEEPGIMAPDMQKLRIGKDLVTSMTAQIYHFAEVAQKSAENAQAQSIDLNHNFIAANMPLPLVILDSTDTIKYANSAAAAYVGMQPTDMIGKNVYMVLDMSFPNEATFDRWLKQVKTSNATATNTWERVRLNIRDGHPERHFDLAAYFNRDNPQHNETMLILFDHTQEYSQDDQAISFIALSVHELRTPLTLLRGYIEVFEDEIDTSNNAELADFMQKMRSQADQLMAFVNNILNVARVDDDQLELHLQEGDWPSILKDAITNLSLRAKVRGIALHCRIATDLPTVGIDRISIIEVINNIVDNAIKYSGESKVINIDTHRTQDGLVETTVQDFGLGISTSIMPNLFTKFYRDHRNRAQIGGTGLGLYLSKAIVTAHGGNLWVRSQEGQGSTFGFTLIPYTQLTEEAKQQGNSEIVRGAHGWIKNHSLYRR